MKNLKIIFCLSLGISLADANYSLAQTYQEHFPTQNVLETSLMGLKDSADQITAQNTLLIEEITNLKSKIKNLHQEAQAMVTMKDQMINHAVAENAPEDQQVQKTKLSQLSMDRIVTELNGFNTQNTQLEQKLSAQELAQQEIIRHISEAENTIAQLNEKEKFLETETQNDPLEQQRQELLKALKKTEDDLMKLERDLGLQSKKNAKPQELLASLKTHNEDLNQQIGMLNEKQVSFDEESKSVRRDLLRIEKGFQKESLRVAQQVKELKKRQSSTQRLLTEAQAKLDGKDLDNAYNQNVENQLKDDLDFIKQENRTLKQEIVLLEQTLEKLDTK